MLWGCTHELRLGLWVGVGQMFYLLLLDFVICMCAGGLDTDVRWMLPRPDACDGEPEYDMVLAAIIALDASLSVLWAICSPFLYCLTQNL